MSIKRFGLSFALAVLALPLATAARQDSPVLIAQVPSYFPLATSTPFAITNSGTPSNSVAPWPFKLRVQVAAQRIPATC